MKSILISYNTSSLIILLIIFIITATLNTTASISTSYLTLYKQQPQQEESTELKEHSLILPSISKSTANPFLNQLNNSHLTLKNLYNINKITNPETDGFNYLNSGYFISNQEEFNLEQTARYQIDSNNNINNNNSNDCILDRYKLISRINSLRDKHQVKRLEYDSTLESQALSYALEMKHQNNCEYYLNEKTHFSELFSVNYSRLSENQVINKWYEPVYHYDFKNKKFKINGINAYSMLNLLWDDTKRVGCSKVCCLTTELVVCDFFPVIIQPNLTEIGLHIKGNKYLK